MERTIEDLIKEFGEIPICSCNKCQITGQKVFVDPKYYNKYKKHGYPKFLVGHGLKPNSGKFKKGQKSWSKGLTKETNESVKCISDKLKGVPKSEEHKHKQSEIMKNRLSDGTWYPYIPTICNCKSHCNEIVYGNHEFIVGHNHKGVPKSEEWKKQQSERMLSDKNHFRGKHLTEEHKQHLRDNHADNSGEKCYWFGKKFSDKHKENIKKSLPRGEDHPKYWLGKHLSEEHKNKIKENAPHISGEDHWSYNMNSEDHWNWQGGITLFDEQIRHCENNKNWIKSVFGRDKYTCQKCGNKSKKDVVAHHIKQFSIILRENNITTLDQALLCPELWDISNGITLCEKCHDKIPIIRHKRKI